MFKAARRRGSPSVRQNLEIELCRLDALVLDERTGQVAQPTLITAIQDGAILALRLVFPSDLDGGRADG